MLRQEDWLDCAWLQKTARVPTASQEAMGALLLSAGERVVVGVGMVMDLDAITAEHLFSHTSKASWKSLGFNTRSPEHAVNSAWQLGNCQHRLRNEFEAAKRDALT